MSGQHRSHRLRPRATDIFFDAGMSKEGLFLKEIYEKNTDSCIFCYLLTFSLSLSLFSYLTIDSLGRIILNMYELNICNLARVF